VKRDLERCRERGRENDIGGEARGKEERGIERKIYEERGSERR
jgi:hypothetical protein